MIVFTLNRALPSLNVRQRKHWAQLTRERNQLVLEVMAAIGGSRHYPRPPYAKARVEIVRCSPGQLDVDGLYGSVKPALDVLCLHSSRHPGSLGIIVDDDPAHCELVVTQQRCSPGQGATIVRVTPL